MRRILILLPVLLALQVGVSPALAWTWPVDGPVLRPFVFDKDNPYTSGQHRGIDVGAPAGARVRAPAAGTVSFAGSVPGGGLTVAIATEDGYSATLVHLGAVTVKRGATVAEGDVVGSVGPSGEPELGAPYVHFGIRVAAEPHGYVDPLSLLPAAVAAPPTSEEGGGGTAKDDAGVEPTPGGGASDPPREHAEAAANESGRSRTRPRPPARRLRVQTKEPLSVPASPGPQLARRETPALSPPRIAPEESATVASLLAARARSVDAAVETVTHPQRTSSGRSPASDGGAWLPPAVLAASLAAAAAVAAALLARRQFGDARGAHGSSPVLPEPVAAPTKDAGFVGFREDDEILVDRDLEGILLAQAEALADLDRDHDAAELVDAPDNARACPARAYLRRNRARRRFRPHQRPATPLQRSLM